MKTSRFFGVLLAGMAAAFDAPVWSQTASEIQEELDVFMGEAREKLGELEGRVKNVEKKTSVSGDVRVRHEYFTQAGDEGASGIKNRGRSRFRARVAVKQEIASNLKAEVRLASGGTSDATSTNQTLSNGFANYGFNLDRAFLWWAPTPLNGHVELLGGKMENPLKKSALNWDGDVNPDGFSAAVKSKNGKTTLSFSYFLLRENSSTTDRYLTVSQLVQSLKAGSTDVTLAGGFTFVPYMDMLTAIPNNPFGQGNVKNPLGPSRDFKVGDVLAEFKKKVGGKSATLILHWAGNLNTFDLADPTKEAQAGAYLVELKYGAVKKKGDWKGSLRWGYLEPNAVLASFSDSDAEYTNRKYVRGSIGLGVDEKIEFDVTAFAIRRVDHGVLGSSESGKPLYRFQFDWVVKI